MSTKIYFIRHGETYWNVQRKMQGQVDIPLNPEGYRQAEDAHYLIRNEIIDVCYTSPLSRARETAESVLSDRKIPIIDEPLLLEQKYGLSEGKRQRLAALNPFSPLFYYKRNPERYKLDIGAESFEILSSRAITFIEKILLPTENVHQGVLISAHGAIICSILSQIFNIPLKDFWSVLPNNCEVKKVLLSDQKFRAVEDRV